MVINSFKFAIRQISRSKLIAFGSIFSLILGVLCPYVIFIWTQSEISADKFHSNYDRIEIISFRQNAMAKPNPFMFEHYGFGNALDFAEVDNSLDLRVYEKGELSLIKGDTEFFGKALVVDSTFFEFFDFPSETGPVNDLLKDPNQIVLTENFAKRIYGDQSPLGEFLELDGYNQGLYAVGAVLKNIPSNSSIDFDFLIPTHSQDIWTRIGVEMLLVNENFNKANLESKLTASAKEKDPAVEVQTYSFQDIYFENPFNHPLFTGTGDKNDVAVMTVIALVILLVSLVNFINLQVTMAVSQSKTRSIKFINGASKKDILRELTFVNLIYCLLSALIGFALLQSFFPYIQELLSKEFQVADWLHLSLLFAGSTVFALLTIIYVSLFTIAKKTVMINAIESTKSGLAKKGVTIVQFVCAVVLTFSSLVIYNQYKFMTNKDLGYDYEHIYSIKLIDGISYTLAKEIVLQKREEQKRNFQLVQSTFQQDPSLVAMTQGQLPLSGSVLPMSWKLVGQGLDYTTHNMMSVDPGFNQVLDIEIVEGRFFADSLDKDRQPKLVINEAAKSYFAIDNIESVRIANAWWGEEDEPFEVIGVVKDFHYQHLSKKVEPLIMMYMRDDENNFVFKIDENRLEAGLKSLKALHSTINPGKVFEYTQLKDGIMYQYQKEKRLSTLILIFTTLALLISMVGLFTLSLFDTRRRIKEVGIRKVLGAPMTSILSLLTMSFMKWVFLAILAGVPLAWWGMNEWLSNFANRVGVSPSTFFLTCSSIVLISFLTIIGQTYLAAKRNPVDSLRYE